MTSPLWRQSMWTVWFYVPNNCHSRVAILWPPNNQRSASADSHVFTKRVASLSGEYTQVLFPPIDTLVKTPTPTILQAHASRFAVQMTDSNAAFSVTRRRNQKSRNC